MTVVALQLLDGSAVNVEANDVATQNALPAALLPPNVANAVRLDVAGDIVDVLGTAAAVAAIIAAGVGFAPTGAAGGYLAGTYPNPSIVGGGAQVFAASGVFTVPATVTRVDVYMRAGAGGGCGGGGGGAGQTAGVTAGGGGGGGGGGADAVGFQRVLTGLTPGEALTVTIGAGGTGGAGGAAGAIGLVGTSGGATEILRGAARLMRTGRGNTPTGAGIGAVGGAGASGAAGGAGGASGAGAAAITSVPQLWGTVSVAGGAGGAGGVGAAGVVGTSTGAPSVNAGPWRGVNIGSATSGNGGAIGGATHGGGGGGGAGGGSGHGDEYSAAGVEATANDGRGGLRTTTEANGGAGNAAGDGAAGVAGASGMPGVNGRGGGGGMGGGGGGAGTGAGGAGASGGAGGAGSDGVVVFAW